MNNRGKLVYLTRKLEALNGAVIAIEATMREADKTIRSHYSPIVKELKISRKDTSDRIASLKDLMEKGNLQ